MQFEVHWVGCLQSFECVVVGVTVELDESGSDFEGWSVLPEVVNEGDSGYALSPEPELSAGLMFMY